MKYLKCVKQLQGETNFKLGDIYELNNENKKYAITCTDTNFGLGQAFTYTGDGDFEEWVKPWYEFEEVTYEDYILQEFVRGKIAIVFDNNDARDYWREKFLIRFEEDNINMCFLTMNSLGLEYYIKDNELEAEFTCKNLKVIILSVPENKKENENMNNEFVKKDLEEGMVIEIRNGDKYLVHNKNFIRNNGWLGLDGYNDELLENEFADDEWDVMKVFNSNALIIDNIFNKNNLELIWEREEEIDLNLKEYSFDELTISPNGNGYNDDEYKPIYVEKEDNDESFALTIEEAEFMIESLTEILNTIKNK